MQWVKTGPNEFVSACKVEFEAGSNVAKVWVSERRFMRLQGEWAVGLRAALEHQSLRPVGGIGVMGSETPGADVA